MLKVEGNIALSLNRLVETEAAVTALAKLISICFLLVVRQLMEIQTIALYDVLPFFFFAVLQKLRSSWEY
ncbi:MULTISPECIES: hypothetical protein [Nostocales]|uniref:Uncharacterized protein n=3 Tax=Nostocales TaxID=1161 RepID=A0A8S9STH7_9CYAN|nr:hypothetical protein [Tolypothrix bouteillei]KAF3883775.1 hypothetical protein DA73_0400039315 [Tolypothrix bouteillei VB521301]